MRTFLLFLLALLYACSNRQLYETVQQNRQLDCQRLPQSQYEDCMQQTDRTFEEFKREREQLLKDEEADRSAG